jgi:hypothetical protein
MVRLGFTLAALTAIGEPQSVQTPSQVILSKLNTMGASWADFFIANVVEREGRAEIFKTRLASRIEKIDRHYVECQSKDFNSRKRRGALRQAQSSPNSERIFDETSGRQVSELSNDPVRSNKQIYYNLKVWIIENMDGCKHQVRHYEKLEQMESKWNQVFNDVLKKISMRRG